MNRFLYALIVVVMAATTVFAVLAWSVHSVVRWPRSRPTRSAPAADLTWWCRIWHDAHMFESSFKTALRYVAT